MKRFQHIILLTLSLALALGLTACGASGPDMPMQADIDGHTVVLGQTTTGDMAGWGWEINFTGSQNEIREDAEYVACHFRIDVAEGSGHEFWVSTYVPFQKNISGSYVDFSAEEAQSQTEGVVYRISLRKDAGDELDITYNGMDFQEILWATVEEWGAKKDEDAYPTTYNLDAAQGSFTFEKSYFNDELGEMALTMNTNAFSKLQK